MFIISLIITFDFHLGYNNIFFYIAVRLSIHFILMICRLIKKLAIISFLFCTCALSANTFRHLNVENGLSSRRVFQIKQDTTGFMWFFTYAGIDRYDGTEMRHYELEGLESTPKNLLFLTKLLLDRNKNVWVVTTNGLIFRYDKIQDKFILEVNLHSHMTDRLVSINSAKFDRADKLWLCAINGLYCFDLPRNQLDFISGFGGESVAAIDYDTDYLYVGTQKNVYRLERNSDGILSIQPLISKTFDIGVESLLYHGKKLYVGTFANSAFVVDLSNQNICHLDSIIPNIPIRTIKPTGNNEILIGADGAGFYSIDKRTDRLISKYVSDEDIPTALKGNTVCDIFVDRRNYIWVATTTNGISIFDPYLPDVNIIQHEYRNNNSLIDNHVNVIYEDSDGDVWYGTNNGVSLYITKGHQWKHFLTGDNIHRSVVLSICEDINKQIWIGGYGIGAFYLNKRDYNVIQLPAKTGDDLVGLPTKYIYSIYADGQNIWFGGINGNLTRYDTGNKIYDYFDIDCVYDIKPDGARLLLSSCLGLYVLDESGNIRFLAFNDYPIRQLLRALDGEIWLATDGKGLIRYNTQTGDHDFFSLKNETAANSVLSIQQDNSERIWFSVESGLYCIDLKTKRILPMADYTGVSNKDYNSSASLKKKNGNFIFGTANGAVEFSPDFEFDESEPAKLIFTDFKLFYKSAKINDRESPLKQSINETEYISLRYSQNSFSFSFSSINYSYPHQVQYLCKLEGFEKDWHEADKNVGYTNIGPGKYAFKLKAVNKLTDSTIDERKIEISIARPLWASDWAVMICTGIIAVIAILIFQYAKTQIEKRNSREKINFFVSLAHDIRTPVTLIKAPLSELENENLTEYGKKTLAVAVKNAEKLSSLVSQLLDFQKIDSMSMELVVSKNELYTYLKDKYTYFSILAKHKGISIELRTDFEYFEVFFDRSKMDKILDNLLSNAIKYTPEKGEVRFTATRDSEKWSVEVKDTGIGIPVIEQKNIFTRFYRAKNAINSKESGSGIGLLLVKKLVQLHSGEIEFLSIENKGTAFKVSFPVKLSSPDNVDTTIESKYETESKERILIVEDNDDMRAYLNNILSKEHRIVEAVDGQQVIEQIQKICPDIIISDIVMPRLNGDRMCKILKSSIETSHIPVILLTALDEKENMIKGFECGADDYIVKPFDALILKARIRNIFENREKLRAALSSDDKRKEETGYSNPLDKEFMKKVTALIEAELSNPEFSINDLCLSIGMSRTSFYHKLKTLTGISPNNYIKTFRLNKARTLLKLNKYNISEVSVIVGFTDAKYFSTSFKKQFGYSPSKLLET
jgi:signal transduction histidine kinase/DNA-binding response OmpR family regulator/ligand-binding sensor domain-containing protein